MNKEGKIKLYFLGAAQEVTGSNYLLETEKARVLIDCGMFQGRRVNEKKNEWDFRYNPQSIDALVLTHAHLDHCGRIPKLFHQGFQAQIFATPPTRDLTEIVLRDAVSLMQEEAKRHNHDPLYKIKDVEKALSHFRQLDYAKRIEIADEVYLEFFEAGHILGSAFAKIEAEGKTIIFSGDLGNPPVPILSATASRPSADYVVMESTYGGRIHETVKGRSEKLLEAIKLSCGKGGVLMVPSFAIERTQEILYELNGLSEKHSLPQSLIYLDSPMAIKATQVFKKYPHYLNQFARDLLKKDDDLFAFPNLRLTITTAQSKQINQAPTPKMIIAGSGMMHGGRIMHHAIRYLSGKNNTLLFVGYQSVGTLGRRLIDGERQVRIYGQTIEVKAQITKIGAYSAHADQPKLLKWLQGDKLTKPRRVFLTHGEPDQQELLHDEIEQGLQFPTSIPSFGEAVKL